MLNTSLLNKTQYLSNVFGFFLFYWVGSNSMHLGLDWTISDLWIVENSLMRQKKKKEKRKGKSRLCDVWLAVETRRPVVTRAALYCSVTWTVETGKCRRRKKKRRGIVGYPAQRRCLVGGGNGESRRWTEGVANHCSLSTALFLLFFLRGLCL